MSENEPTADRLFADLVENCAPSQWDDRLASIRNEFPELADDVEALLYGHTERSAQESATESDPTLRIDDAELVDMAIGPYRVRRKIGEGGFGVVYFADQVEPFHREVALKLIKPGMDSREVIARFKVERQALAMMDHPHIAGVLDAGVTEKGRPYFVMEYVNGRRITAFCDRERLTIPERLRLFVDVCRAIQHAHQKGIIHRDLKPSNILVMRQDGAVIPKVIDFGVAKALSRQLTDHSIHTALDQLIGTPMYMSPEQAEMGGLDIDTRSDVYSMGVVLYRLLSGTTPFDPESLNSANAEELRRILRDREPLRPSLQLSTLNEDVQTTVCDERQVDLRRLKGTLHGELDWIVMKAMEKDRSRRYESPAALADDIERYLAGEVVAARPPSTIYRLRKFARQHRGAFATVAVVLLALLSGLAVALLQWNEAVKARALAEQRLLDVDRHRERAESLLYVSDVRLAARSLQEGDVRQTVELLNRHRPGPDGEDRRGFEWHLLMRQAQGNTSVVAPSELPLYNLRLCPTQPLLVTAGADGTVYLLDSRTLEQVSAFDSGQREVNGLTFTKDGTRLLTAGDDGTVCVWSFPEGKRLTSIHYGNEWAFAAVLDSDEESVFVAGRQPEIGRFSLSSGESIGQLVGHERTVDALAMSADGRLLASVSADQKLMLWDSETQKRVFVAERGERISAVAMLREPPLVLDGDIDGYLTLTDANAGRTEAVLHMGAPIQSLAVSPDETAVVVGTRDGYLHLVQVVETPYGGGYDLATVTSWEAHTDRVFGVVWDGEGSVISASRDGTLCRSRLSHEARRGEVLPVADTRYVALSPDGQRLAWSTWHRVGTYDLQTQESHDLPGLPAGLPWSNVVWTPDGQHLAAATRDGRLFLYPIADPESAVSHDTQLRSGIEITSISRDGKRLVVVSRGDDQIKVIAVPSFEEEFVVSLADNFTAVLTPDGRRLALNRGRDLLIIDVESRRTIVESRDHHDEAIRSILFQRDGSEIVTIASDQTIRIWNPDAGGVPDVVGVHASGGPLAFALAGDGRTAVSGTTGGVLNVWHLPTRQLLFPMGRIDTHYRQVKLSADLSLMVTVDGRGIMRLYRLGPVSPGDGAGASDVDGTAVPETSPPETD